MNDKMLHTIQFIVLIVVATILILFGHNYLSPELVFTSIIAGLAGIIGSRIANNNYQNNPPTKE